MKHLKPSRSRFSCLALALLVLVGCDSWIFSLSLLASVPQDQIPQASADMRCWLPHYNGVPSELMPLTVRATFDPVGRTVAISMNHLWATRDIVVRRPNSAPSVTCSSNTVGDSYYPPPGTTGGPSFFTVTVELDQEDTFTFFEFARATPDASGIEQAVWALNSTQPMPANHGR